MPTNRPRVQVTLDPELASALAAVDPNPPSRSGLIRDLALRGALVERQARDREEAIAYLVAVADGGVELDLEASRAAWEERERGWE